MNIHPLPPPPINVLATALNSNDMINVATLKILNFILKQDKRKVQTIFVVRQ